MDIDTDNIPGTLSIWCRISKQLGEMNAFLKSALEKIDNHENRIMRLEDKRHFDCRDDGKDDWKAQLLMLLAKSVTIGTVVIAVLAGAEKYLKGIAG